METYVHLSVIPERIGESVWGRVYEESEALLSQWPGGTTTLAWRTVAGRRVACYSEDFRTETGWKIEGDRQSLLAGESFCFPRALHAGDRRGAPALPVDVLVCLASRGEGPCAARIFGDKTQRLPYHPLVVAVGLLVEHRFPEAAVVWGNIDDGDAKLAGEHIERVLGERVARPVVLDEERVRRRLRPHIAVDRLEESVARVTAGTRESSELAAALIRYTESTPDGRLRSDLQSRALTGSPAELGEPTRRYLGEMMRSARTLVELGTHLEEAVECEPTREHLLACIAESTDRNRVYLSETAWDALEAVDAETLRLLFPLSLMAAGSLDAHNAVRALLENPALREAM